MHQLENKKLFLLDMDGTLYLGNDLFPETLPFLEQIKSHGARAMYLTNNSSKSVSRYVEKLASFGIVATEDDFLTSSQATAIYLLEHYKDKLLYVLGTASLCEELKNAGLNITTQLQDGIDCLVMGYDTELVYQKLVDACILLGQGVDYIATNPDFVCPTEFGYVPDCGSVSIMLKNATGREPLFIGKPQKEMVELALKKAGMEKPDAVLIGDRIYTDIAAGQNAGVDTVLVLSGETTLEQARESTVKPTYILQNVGEIFR